MASNVYKDCCKPAPPSEYKGKGSYETLAGLRTYVNKPASAKKAVILASDVFGSETPSVRRVAEKVADAGYYAVVPDLFKGDPFVPADPANPFGNFPPWIEKHMPIDSVDVTKAIVKELKESGFESVGLSGFCWGSKIAVELSKVEAVKVVVLLHPSFIGDEDIENSKVATCMLSSEIDNYVAPAKAEEYGKILSAKPFPSFYKMFYGMEHGWSIRYDVNVPEQVKAAEEAHALMLDFYAKNL